VGQFVTRFGVMFEIVTQSHEELARVLDLAMIKRLMDVVDDHGPNVLRPIGAMEQVIG
jgi:hypothetical protein